MSDELLRVENLRTSFFTDNGEVKAVNDVSFTVNKGMVLGIVGESGSGKSVTAYSILRILQHPGKVIGGKILLHGQNLLELNEKDMQKIRGNQISMIFQDPMTSLNPVFTIGDQIEEAIKKHTDKKNSAAIYARTIELLGQVGINDPERRIRQYPFEFSGGMRQRAMIAMALACEPDLLIADEPTTALDVTIQAQILDLLKSLQKQIGLSIILITHNLGVVASLADEIMVMYGGSACERGSTDEIFYQPKHAYTLGLLRCIPTEDKTSEKLIPIPGNPVDVLNLPPGCPFVTRCPHAMKVCIRKRPPVIQFSESHYASCWLNVCEKFDLQNTIAKESSNG